MCSAHAKACSATLRPPTPHLLRNVILKLPFLAAVLLCLHAA
jgi:hypothetical protein